jgi:N-methylhydantoinase B
VCGGASGARNRFWVRRDGQPIAPSRLPGKVGGFPLQPEDLLLMESSGGGGFGDPLVRDPALVVADVAEGYVTRDAAESAYGVVWTGDGVNADETARRRASLAAARSRVSVSAGDIEAGLGRRIRIDAETARRLGVAEGAVVELVNPRGAPLRAWVAGIMPGDGHRAEIAAEALRMLAITDGALLEIRAVHSGNLAAG